MVVKSEEACVDAGNDVIMITVGSFSLIVDRSVAHRPAPAVSHSLARVMHDDELVVHICSPFHQPERLNDCYL